VGGAKIEKALVQQLLNEVGDDPDQLPILQHALMRTWEYWEQLNDPEKSISLSDYEAIGKMEKALSIIFIAFALLYAGSAIAAQDIAGIWEGRLETGPGAALTVQFKIKTFSDFSPQNHRYFTPQ